MHKGREITGLPVVSLASGKEIGLVDDILWSHSDLKIRYLEVGDHHLPFPDISSIGTDAVTISGQEVLVEQIKEISELKSINQTGGEVVLTENGENLESIQINIHSPLCHYFLSQLQGKTKGII